MRNSVPKKALAQLDKTADKYASVFFHDSTTEFKMKLARVVLSETPIKRAEALNALLSDLAFCMDPEFVEFLKNPKVNA